MFTLTSNMYKNLHSNKYTTERLLTPSLIALKRWQIVFWCGFYTHSMHTRELIVKKSFRSHLILLTRLVCDSR